MKKLIATVNEDHIFQGGTQSAPKDCDLIIIECLREIYAVGHVIKYLHQVARFAIKNRGPKGGDSSEVPPSMGIKPTTNPEMTRVRCGFATDSAEPKSWIESNATKSVAGKAVYLIISDAKEDGDFRYR